MKLGILVNNINTEEPGYTTTRLAMAAINRGHEVWVMGAGDLAYDSDEFIRAKARSASRSVYKSSDTYINDLQGRQATQKRITVDDLDVLKPLQGSGGQSVFLVRESDGSNLNQTIDAVSRDGYVIAQKYLPAAEDGDTRLFLMNGQPPALPGQVRRLPAPTIR